MDYKNWKNIPVPSTMAHLPRDKRGYPIPANVTKDSNGVPLFTVNNEDVRQKHIQKELCGICGRPLWETKWLVGGPLSAFHKNGRYIDTAMHKPCAEYALQVCPYLALSRNMKLRSPETLKQLDLGNELAIAVDSSMMEERPDLFVMVGCKRIGKHMLSPDSEQVLYVFPRGPGLKYEFWKDGRKLSPQEGRRLSDEFIAQKALQDANLL